MYQVALTMRRVYHERTNVQRMAVRPADSSQNPALAPEKCPERITDDDAPGIVYIRRRCFASSSIVHP